MTLNFTKMEGCGNDYIYFDCFKQDIKNPEELAVKISDRHFGIGGDGIVLIMPSKKDDARMRMFNIDGSEGKMCGNAIRCVAKLLFDNKIVTKNPMTIETLSGTKELFLTIENDEVSSVRVDMGDAILTPCEIPVKIDGDTAVNHALTIDGKVYEMTCVSMGNPHAVTFLDEVSDLDLINLGPKFENHEIFPERVNTEFIKFIDKNTLEMRVWERGSGETLACGTGACASVVAAVLTGRCNKNEDVKVKLIGGDLIINYTDETVFMTGPATKVFDGSIDY